MQKFKEFYSCFRNTVVHNLFFVNSEMVRIGMKFEYKFSHLLFSISHMIKANFLFKSKSFYNITKHFKLQRNFLLIETKIVLLIKFMDVSSQKKMFGNAQAFSQKEVRECQRNGKFLLYRVRRKKTLKKCSCTYSVNLSLKKIEWR
jgi:hypothetical protein